MKGEDALRRFERSICGAWATDFGQNCISGGRNFVQLSLSLSTKFWGVEEGLETQLISLSGSIKT
jgi:hypothetical protein